MKLFTKTRMMATVVDTNEIDRQIHSDIYSAGDRLLVEANNILSRQATEESLLGETIGRMGFHQAKNIALYASQESLAQRSLILKNTILKYKERYPLYKFIDLITVKNICKKYGLVLGSPHRFTGEIPLKNQREIADFRVHGADAWSYEPQTGWSSEKWGKPSKSYEQNDALVAGRDLWVVAPISQFDMQGVKIMDHAIVSKDPIVLQPVEGGFLIVTAWGAEASDPAIVNENHN